MSLTQNPRNTSAQIRAANSQFVATQWVQLLPLPFDNLLNELPSEDDVLAIMEVAVRTEEKVRDWAKIFPNQERINALKNQLRGFGGDVPKHFTQIEAAEAQWKYHVKTKYKLIGNSLHEGPKGREVVNANRIQEFLAMAHVDVNGKHLGRDGTYNRVTVSWLTKNIVRNYVQRCPKCHPTFTARANAMTANWIQNKPQWIDSRKEKNDKRVAEKRAKMRFTSEEMDDNDNNSDSDHPLGPWGVVDMAATERRDQVLDDRYAQHQGYDPQPAHFYENGGYAVEYSADAQQYSAFQPQIDNNQQYIYQGGDNLGQLQPSQYHEGYYPDVSMDGFDDDFFGNAKPAIPDLQPGQVESMDLTNEDQLEKFLRSMNGVQIDFDSMKPAKLLDTSRIDSQLSKITVEEPVQPAAAPRVSIYPASQNSQLLFARLADINSEWSWKTPSQKKKIAKKNEIAKLDRIAKMEEIAERTRVAAQEEELRPYIAPEDVDVDFSEFLNEDFEATAPRQEQETAEPANAVDLALIDPQLREYDAAALAGAAVVVDQEPIESQIINDKAQEVAQPAIVVNQEPIDQQIINDKAHEVAQPAPAKTNTFVCRNSTCGETLKLQVTSKSRPKVCPYCQWSYGEISEEPKAVEELNTVQSPAQPTPVKVKTFANRCTTCGITFEHQRQYLRLCPSCEEEYRVGAEERKKNHKELFGYDSDDEAAAEEAAKDASFNEEVEKAFAEVAAENQFNAAQQKDIVPVDETIDPMDIDTAEYSDSEVAAEDALNQTDVLMGEESFFDAAIGYHEDAESDMSEEE